MERKGFKGNSRALTVAQFKIKELFKKIKNAGFSIELNI